MATGTAAVTVSQQSAQASSNQTALNIIADEPTSGFDPNIAVTQASIRVMELIYDHLLDYNASGAIVPDLAKSWSLSSNGLTYTFNLQPNAKFSNGDPITGTGRQVLTRSAWRPVLRSSQRCPT